MMYLRRGLKPLSRCISYLKLVILQPAMLVNSGCVYHWWKQTNNLSAFSGLEVWSLQKRGDLGLAMLNLQTSLKSESQEFPEKFPFRAKCCDTWAARDVAGKFSRWRLFVASQKVAHLQTKQLGLKEEIHVLNLFLASFGCFSPNMYCIFFLPPGFRHLKNPNHKTFLSSFAGMIGKNTWGFFLLWWNIAKETRRSMWTSPEIINRHSRHSIALRFFAEGPLRQTAMEKCMKMQKRKVWAIENSVFL